MTVDFTREPIIETIITPKEGYKLVIRSSKSAGQEEYFVDAVEVVAFGNTLFFRSLDKPKAFLVPVSDYEILEVREARMVLKNAGLDRSIKIGGGRENNLKAAREVEKVKAISTEESGELSEVSSNVESSTEETKPEIRVDKKRDRRRNYRKRRGRDETAKEDNIETASVPTESEKMISPNIEEGMEAPLEVPAQTPNYLSSLLQPPPTLISETINRYRQNDLFKSAFYLTEEEQYKPHDKVQELLSEDDDDENIPSLQEPSFDAEIIYPSTELNISETSPETELMVYFDEQGVSVQQQPHFEERSQPEENVEKQAEMNLGNHFPVDLEEEKKDFPHLTLPTYAEEDISMEKKFHSNETENEKLSEESHQHHDHPDHHDER